MKLIRPAIAAVLACAGFASAANAGVNVSVGIGLPGVYVGPPPVMYAPAPVYYAPPPRRVVVYEPVVVQPAPVYYQAVVVHKPRKHHKHWRHRHHD